MSKEPTIHSLYEFMRDMREEHGKMFEQIKGKQDVTNTKIESFEQWRVQHEADDKVAHVHMHTRISKQRNLAGIFGSIGFMGGFIIALIGAADKIKHWWVGS